VIRRRLQVGVLDDGSERRGGWRGQRGYRPAGIRTRDRPRPWAVFMQGMGGLFSASSGASRGQLSGFVLLSLAVMKRAPQKQ